MDLEQALAKIKELEGEKASLTQTNTELTTQLSEKDSKITELNEHLQEKGRQFKALRDMTKEEKELLSEREIELLERQEATEKAAADLKAQQDGFFQKQRETLVKALVGKYARGDEELAKKIELNLSEIKNSELAMDEAALAPLVQKSFNMLGSEVTNDVRNAHNERGEHFEANRGEPSFADSQKGKDLSEALFGKEETN